MFIEPNIIEKAMQVNEDKRMLKEELDIISNWCEKYYKGGNTLEIGAYKGMTSYLLSSVVKQYRKKNEGHEDSKHYIVDLFEVVGDIQWEYGEHTRQMLIDNIGELANYTEVIKSPSLGYVALDQIFARHFDYVFIDGDHTFPVVLMELLMCEITCDKILGHDYGHNGVTRSVDQFCKLRGYEVYKPNGNFGLFELIKR
jgi:hypothetical protein